MEDTAMSSIASSYDDSSLDTIIRINVGGSIFMTKLRTLRKRGIGKLSNITLDDPAFVNNTGEFFFDRDPNFFTYVIQFYRTGELHISDSCCTKTIRSEMEFWGLDVDTIGDCCWGNYCKGVEQMESTTRLTKHLKFLSETTPTDTGMPLTYKQRLWLMLENPTSSNPAKIWAIVSVILLIISILCYALTTLPEAKRGYSRTFDTNNSMWTDAEIEASEKFLFSVTIVDICCLVFFTVDLFLRILSVPRKGYLFTSFLFYCDLIFLIPGWMLDLIILFGWQLLAELAKQNNVVIVVIQIFTVTRLFRIFRLAGYFQGIRILLYVLKASFRELLLLGVFISIGVLLYGFLIYGVEVGENQNFDSAFRGFWWAIITMSTVGYGDFYPISTLGYIIAALCAISGLVIIGLPIPIIASNFDLYYGFRARGGHKNVLADSKVQHADDAHGKEAYN